MNIMVMIVFYDQFHKLNEDFGQCVGDRGQFNGNFEHFRRRHQSISCSVQEADCFLMISNVACFACQMIIIIIVLYSTIFYQEKTVLRDGDEATMHILWLLVNVLGLAIATGLAVAVNVAVS